MMKAELSNIRPRLDELGNAMLTKVKGGAADESEGSEATRATQSTTEVDSREGAERRPKSAAGIPVFHVNTNKFPQVGARNNIHGLPTLVLFRGGEEIWRHEGIMLGEDLMNALTKLLLEGRDEKV